MDVSSESLHKAGAIARSGRRGKKSFAQRQAKNLSDALSLGPLYTDVSAISSEAILSLLRKYVKVLMLKNTRRDSCHLGREGIGEHALQKPHE